MPFKILFLFFLLGHRKSKKRSQVSCREYYCYKLQIRTLGNSILLHAGRLLQQYVVDMYVKTETSRLDYFRNNQKIYVLNYIKGLLILLEQGKLEGIKLVRKLFYHHPSLVVLEIRKKDIWMQWL